MSGARLDAWTPANFGTTDYSGTTWAVMPNHSRFMDHRALELLKELSSQGGGFALLIDDADELPLKDLEAVCAALHEATQDGLRVTSALSGLPTLPAKLAEAQSYAERLFYFLPIALSSPSHRE